MMDLDLFLILADKIAYIYDPSRWGECNEINATIAKFLHIKGFNVIPVAGYVNCDNKTTVDHIYDPTHFWIRYNGKVLDFASAQFRSSFFDEELNSKMNSPYFLGVCDNYVEIDSYPIDNEFVDKDLIEEWTNNKEKYINLKK